MTVSYDGQKLPIERELAAVRTRDISLIQFSPSSSNYSITPLSGGATYTGTAELNGFSDVGCSVYTDQAGTLYFEFRNPGSSTWHTFPPSGFSIAANTHEFHTAIKLPREFRVRYVNGGSAQSTFELYTYFGTFRQGNAPIGMTIASDADAIVTKSVIAGVGEATAGVTDHRALLVTPPSEGRTAFGETVVAEPTPVIQITSPYNVNDALLEKRENQSGTVTHANRQIVVSSGAAANSGAEVRSRRIAKYNPGQGIMARMTAVFTTGVANSTQIAGIGNESDGLFVGYNGTSFGILHRRNGKPEIRTLTISTASSTAENITITLDGDAASVAVTNSANTTTTANEIAAHDYSDVGTGWTAKAVGAKVEFRSWDAATHDGTFSLSGASTAVGTFAQNVVGAAPTETWIPQASWNGADIFDGNGLTGVTLNPTKGNVYQFRYQWLGYGLLSVYVEDPDDGELHLVHSIEYANANTTPSFGDPSLQLVVNATNTSNTSNLTISSPSMAAFIEGKAEQLGVRLGVRNTKTSVTTSLLPIVSVRQGEHANGYPVQTFSRIIRASAGVEHTKPIQIVFIENGTLTGASWADIETDASSLQVDTAATAITGGRELFSLPLGKAGQQELDFSGDHYANILSPGTTITAAAIANSGTLGEASVALNLLERL